MPGSFSINISADIRDTTRYLSRVQREAVPRASAMALNRTASTVRTDAGKRGGSIQSNRNLKSGDIKKRIVVFKANSRKQAALLVGSGKAVPLIDYRAKATKRGVSVNIKGKRTLIKGAFIKTMKSGHRGVFVRRDKRRLPVDELYSSTVADAMNNAPVRARMVSVAKRRFAIEFERALAHQLRRVA